MGFPPRYPRRPSPYSYTAGLDELYRVPPPSIARAAGLAQPAPEPEPEEESAIARVLRNGWDAAKGVLNTGSAAMGLVAANPHSSYNLTRQALGALPGGLERFLPDTTAAYERAFQDNTNAASAEGTRNLSIGEVLAAAPGPGQVGAEALLPGQRQTAPERILKNTGSLVGDMVLDPTILATGGLSAAAQAAKEGRLLSAGAKVLGSAPAAAIYAPDIVRGTYESGSQAVDALREGRPGDAVEPGIQALLTGGLGLLMAHGAHGEVRDFRESRAPRNIAEAVAREQPPAPAPAFQDAPPAAPLPARDPGALEVPPDILPGPPVAPDAGLEALAAVPPPSAAAAAPTTASVPFMVTRRMTAELGQLGYDQASIDRMSPAEAWRVLQAQEAPPALANEIPAGLSPSEALRARLAREGAAAPLEAPEVAPPDAPPSAAALPPIVPGLPESSPARAAAPVVPEADAQASPPPAEPRYAFRARNVGEQGVPAVSHAQASLSEADVRRVAPSRTEDPQEVVRVNLDSLKPEDYEVIDRPGQPSWVRFTRELPEDAVERVGPVDAVDVAAASKAEPPVRAAVATADTADLAQVTGLSMEDARKGADDVAADGVREFSPEAVAIKRAVIAGQVDVPETMTRRQASRGKQLPQDERGQKIYPGEEALTPVEREALNGVVAARVRELELAQKSQPTGRRPILGGVAMNDVQGYQGTPSHKTGTALEGISEGPKEIVDAYRRDHGNALELRIRDAILRNDDELAEHFDRLAEIGDEGDASFDVEKYAVRAAPGQRGLADIAADVPVEASKERRPEQRSMFGGEMLQGVEARGTEGREREGALFTQERDARERQAGKAQGSMFDEAPPVRTAAPTPAERPLPPRTADTMSDAIAIASPNGRMSKRAHEAATRRLGEKLFGPGGGTREQIMGKGPPQPSAREADLAQAKRLRDHSGGGANRKFIREAERLEALHADPPAGALPEADPKYSVMPAQQKKPDELGFFSQLERAADAVPQAMRGSDLLRYLKDPKRAIKADEIKWTGLDDFLQGKADQKVTPEELRAFVRENRVEVKEVTLGDALNGKRRSPEGWADEAERLVRASDRARAQGDTAEADRLYREAERAEQMAEELSGEVETMGGPARLTPKFGQYTLPGGENYREVLLTMPGRPASPDLRAREAETARLAREAMDHLDRVRDTPDEADARVALSRLNAEASIANRDAAESSRSNNFQGGHYDEPNILAHVRLNDRVDADGKKVLFVEEIQSDWAQKGRREGFDNEAEFERLVKERDAAPDDSQERETLQNRIDAMGRTGSKGVPSAPFVDSTEKWTDLALKRVLRLAAEGDYDRVAWTTGEQQAARYDLSKQISKIEYVRKPDGDGVVRAWDTKGSSVIDKEATPTELVDIIGKEAAEKILASRPAYETGNGKPVHVLEGLDLKVGGEGMRGFYDKILPQRMAALGKKWGAKVGAAEIGGIPDERMRQIAGPGMEHVKDAPSRVHAIDITPEMRRSVTEEGLPKFATAPKMPGDASRAEGVPRDVVAKAFPTGKITDHEGGHLVTLPGDRQIRVTQAGDILYNPAAFKAGYGRRLKPGETIAGSWKQIDRGGLIQLAKDAPLEPTLLHESFHAAMDLALTDAEHAAVLKRYGTEEKAADAYGTWQPAKQTNSWFSKIYAFARNLVRSFSPTWESTFERVRSGKAFEGPGRAPKPAAAGGAPPRQPPGPPSRPVGMEPEAARAGARHGGKSKGKPPETLINLDRIAEPKDVREIEGRVQEALRERGHEARSYRSWSEARDRAVASGLTEADVKRLLKEKGSLSDVEIEAGRMLRETAFKDMRDKLETMRKLQMDGKDYGEAERAYNLAAAKAAGIMLTTVRAGGEAGRALAIHRKMSTAMTPAEASKWRAKLADPKTPDAEKYAIRQKLAQASILSEQEQLLQRAFKQLPAASPEFGARFLATPEGDHRAMAALLRAEFRPTLKSKAYELWINGLLSGPPTHLANMTGNALTQLLRIPERVMAAAVDVGRSAVTGRTRERFLGEALADVKMIREGLGKAAHAFRESWADEFKVMGGGKLEHQVGAIGGKTGSAVRSPGRLLQASDEAFKALAATRESGALAYRKARAEGKTGRALADRMSDILADLESHPEILDGMHKAAEYQTFTKALGEFAQRGMALRDASGPLKVLAPFYKTPINVMKYALERTPLNFARVLSDPKLRNAEELAKPILGTLLGMGFAMMADEGILTGGGPSDDKKRQALEATGWQPYSLKVGDTYYSIQRLEPLSSIAGIAADLVEAKDEDTKRDLVNKIVGTVTQNVTNKSFLQGPQNAFQAWSDPTRYAGQWVKGLEGSLVPAIAARTAQAIDPTVRETNATDGSAIAARIPGLSKLLPEKRRGTGEPVERDGTGNAAVDAALRFASPVSVKREKGSEADLERAFIAADYVPSAPSRKLTIPKGIGGRGQRIELSESEYKYVLDARERVTARLRQVVGDPRFKRMDSTQQAEYMRKLYEAGQHGAQAQLWRTRDLRQRAAAALREQGGRA